MTTLLQTSESKLAVRSRTSLCLREGNPPQNKDLYCSFIAAYTVIFTVTV